MGKKNGSYTPYSEKTMRILNYLRTIQCNSMAAAARALGVPPSTVRAVVRRHWDGERIGERAKRQKKIEDLNAWLTDERLERWSGEPLCAESKDEKREQLIQLLASISDESASAIKERIA